MREILRLDAPTSGQSRSLKKSKETFVHKILCTGTRKEIPLKVKPQKRLPSAPREKEKKRARERDRQKTRRGAISSARQNVNSKIQL